MTIEIVTADKSHLQKWAQLRIKLWDWDTVEDHREEAERLYCEGDPDRMAYVAIASDGQMLGFAEATIRRDYVEGCDTSPVAFLEGIYVIPAARKTGIARALARNVADWGKSRNCTEYASNALLDNIDSHNFHAAIGFVETERVVFFRTELK
jgi:aminoglycoside 6'-N-acetyltransferase I